MPTYEYRCKACGHELEVVQSFTDDALTRCEACGADQLRKVFGSVGISFKGSGFYKNDSRGKAPASASSSTDKAGSSAGGDGNGSSSSSDSGSTPASTPSAPPASAPASPSPSPA